MRQTHNLSLITGGAGFIGANLAHRLLARGGRVRIFDNLGRRGAEFNLRWLRERFEGRLDFVRGDIRDAQWVATAMSGADVVFHLAAQVAVTTSVREPRRDFEINALGSLNVLEAARQADPPPVVLLASTNKVYGELGDLRIAERDGRYAYLDFPYGVAEDRPLDFHSPYGCSKGAADQYARDYARIFGVPTAICRMSCIYGTRQFGDEDQGWVAHFVISACYGRPLTIYGDGRQVRDVLFIDDLLDAYELAVAGAREHCGEVFNIGGGPANTLSLLELVASLEQQLQRSLQITFDGWRPGDQRVYVSDIRRAERQLGWAPRTSVEDGLNRLIGWVQEHRHLFDGGV